VGGVCVKVSPRTALLLLKIQEKLCFLLLATPRFELEKILATRSKLILGKKKQIPNLKGYLSSLVFAQNEY
jgi:hypothetical protein